MQSPIRELTDRGDATIESRPSIATSRDLSAAEESVENFAVELGKLIGRRLAEDVALDRDEKRQKLHAAELSHR